MAFIFWLMLILCLISLLPVYDKSYRDNDEKD